MKFFSNIILLFVITIAPSGCTNDSIEKSEKEDEVMNETICIQQGGIWSQQEDLFDDGSFDVYFACSCPQKKSDKAMIIFEGSSESCK